MNIFEEKRTSKVNFVKEAKKYIFETNFMCNS